MPLSKGLCKRQLLRFYYQLQVWLGNKLDATKYGWRNNDKGYQPIYTLDNLIPDENLKQITWKCTTGCETGRCSCRKHEMNCTEKREKMLLLTMNLTLRKITSYWEKWVIAMKKKGHYNTGLVQNIKFN